MNASSILFIILHSRIPAYVMEYLLTAILLTPGGSSAVTYLHNNSTQNNTIKQNTQCTGPCGSLVCVQVAHRHNNDNSLNKPTWNTYNINTLFTSSCSCVNTYVLCTLHVLQLRTYRVPEYLCYSCGCKTLNFSTIS